MLNLTVTLAVLEWKLRFYGSALGYLWQLMRPLLLFGVLYAVFTQFIRFGEGVRFYPALLLLGIVLFTFFSDATGRAVTAVVDKENLVRKIEFPRLVVPLSVILTAAFNLAFNVLAVLAFVLATGVDPRLSWLTLPLFVLGVGAFAAGPSLLISALYVRLRDLRPIWEVFLQVMFYGSPILYVIELIPSPSLQKAIVLLNPLATMMVQARATLIDERAPNAWDVAGGAPLLAIPALIVIGLLALGFWVFNREAPAIAEEL